MKLSHGMVLVLCALFLTTGIALAKDSPDEKANAISGQQNDIYINNQPPHVYDYSAQRDIVIQLYDATVPRMPNTWTVFLSETGVPLTTCASKGYGIPFGVQLTNSQYPKEGNSVGEFISLPQSEPSGLWTDSVTTSATWVICDFGNGVYEPTYSEPEVMVFTHPVTIDENGKIVHQAAVPSISVSWQDK